MPRWIPTTRWKERDVFVIGGGDSLKTFDWNLLKNECTVGCNLAFKLGADVCKVCVFGDPKFFKKYRDELQKYKGVLFTNATQLQRSKYEWLWTLPRKTRGLGIDALGWNTNTGAVAINLALILGAKRVFLLGFDMRLSKNGKPNWHDGGLDKASARVYEKFILGFERMAPHLERVFPGREIINVTDDSDLDCFPKVNREQFWKERS